MGDAPEVSPTILLVSNEIAKGSRRAELAANGFRGPPS
jgi:hypothetical protein